MVYVRFIMNRIKLTNGDGIGGGGGAAAAAAVTPLIV